mmetsp:Transcript_87199/g.251487  ORF Transcript_87199/g.251487 Transcript_87199/m.251487 type:complete len:283 (+) Transcript_87199:320-1168(+)
MCCARGLPVVQGRGAPLPAVLERPGQKLPGGVAQLSTGGDVLSFRQLRRGPRAKVCRHVASAGSGHWRRAHSAELRGRWHGRRILVARRVRRSDMGGLPQGLRLQVLLGQPHPCHHGLPGELQEQDSALGRSRAQRRTSCEPLLVVAAWRGLRGHAAVAVHEKGHDGLGAPVQRRRRRGDERFALVPRPTDRLRGNDGRGRPAGVPAHLGIVAGPTGTRATRGCTRTSARRFWQRRRRPSGLNAAGNPGNPLVRAWLAPRHGRGDRDALPPCRPSARLSPVM